MPRTAAKQDAQDARKTRAKTLESAIGREVRAFRHQQAMTVAELAEKSGLSMGMLSKIENGNISPSLNTLQSLAAALCVPISTFFRRHEQKREAVHVKQGEATEIKRTASRHGLRYHFLGHIGPNSGGVMVEPYLVTLGDSGEPCPTFQHDGVQLIYVLDGEVRYRHGDRLYHLQPGDSLLFDADAPHGPEASGDEATRFLSFTSYPHSG